MLNQPKKIQNKKKAKQTKKIDPTDVKLHIFLPSGLRFWTVVGNDKEYIQLPLTLTCCCPGSYFKLIHGQEVSCRHSEALNLAISLHQYDIVIGDDTEISTFLSYLLEV